VITNRELTENRTAGAPQRLSTHESLDRDELLAMAQGAYYAATGVWALVDIDSFQAVTGPKVDQWLVKTVGVLVTVIGGALGLAGWRRRVTPEVRLLALGSALGLAGIDIYYVAKGRIARIYLADAASELAMAAGWAASASGPQGVSSMEREEGRM
jgi:hypothetical protein